MAKTLILPCTIDANNCINNGRKDIETRKSDYLFSIKKYYQTTSLKLIVAENSGYDLSFLKESLQDNERIEFVSIKNNDSASIYGKGHSEKQLLRYVLQNSVFLKNEDFFYKVSGRYFSPEIESIINNIDTSNIDSVQREAQPNGNISTVFFGAKKDKFLDFFSDELIISDAFLILETAYAQYVEYVGKRRTVELPPMRYENSICSNGQQIHLH